MSHRLKTEDRIETPKCFDETIIYVFSMDVYDLLEGNTHILKFYVEILLYYHLCYEMRK